VSHSNAIPPEQIRRPVVAGQFYTDDPKALAREVDGYLREAAEEIVSDQVLALIAPHAGYMYSGQVAGYAYRQVQGQRFQAVVVVAPSHRAAFAGASVYHRGGFQTPLGIVPVAERLAVAIMAQGERLNFYPQAHELEHSLEVQLPFLQRALGDFQLVPIVMGDHDLPTCQMLAGSLASALKGQEALLVASTDLSHYHSYDQAVQLDKVVLEKVKAFDPLGLHQSLIRGHSEACGAGPMVAVMLAAEKLGANAARVLRYANSGDVTGDRGQVVGYMAAAVFRQAERRDEAR
jgi:AmmeMemoRadiSam system protein B